MKIKQALVQSAFFVATLVNAQASHVGHHADSAAPAAVAGLSDGEVRKIDFKQGKVTLRHGPLVNLDMPAMTMVFTVADRSQLQGLRPGDKVRFAASNQNGTLIASAIVRTTQLR